MHGNVKNTVKDSVFTNLFKNKKYLLQLYQALHPEDKETTESQLENITINNVFINGIYNDLSFLAGNKLLIMAEAQSTWSTNVIIRMFIYLAQTYHEYFKEHNISLYSSTKAELPEPELYIIYTGSRRNRKKYISLTKEFFGGKGTDIELKAKVIYGGKGNNIINQYVKFTKVYNEQVKKHGRTKKAVLETICICKNKNWLKEYLESREKEVVGIMMSLFDQEEALNTYIINERKAAEKNTAKETAINFLKAGKCSINEIKELVPQLDDSDIMEIKQHIQQKV